MSNQTLVVNVILIWSSLLTHKINQPLCINYIRCFKLLLVECNLLKRSFVNGITFQNDKSSKFGHFLVKALFYHKWARDTSVHILHNTSSLFIGLHRNMSMTSLSIFRTKPQSSIPDIWGGKTMYSKVGKVM